MFLIAAVNAPPLVLPPSYLNSSGVWIPLPGALSAITPGPFPPLPTSNGTNTLVSGMFPPGTYDLVLVCDLFNNGHLDAVVGPPVCLSGAFDFLHLILQ